MRGRGCDGNVSLRVRNQALGLTLRRGTENGGFAR